MERKNNKSTNSEKEQRVTEVLELLLLSYSRYQILQYASKWGVTDRQVDTYIADANKLILDEFNEDRKTLIARQKKKLAKLYQKNMKIEDFRECRAIIETENKLFGINEPEKHDVNIKGSISPDKWLQKMKDNE